MYISKIKVGNVVYDIKDSVAQSEYIGTRITLESAPTSSTLTSGSYTFKIGDEVRVLDASKGDSSTNDYIYYKLYDLVNNHAYWGVAGTGSGERVTGTATISINLSVNGVSTNRTTESPVITLTNTNDSSNTFSHTWTGNNLRFSGLTPYSTYSVTVGNIPGYDTPTISDIVIGIGTSVDITATYTATEYMLSIDSNQIDKSDISSAQLVVTDGTLTKTFTYGDSDNKFRFPTANTISITSSSDVANYKKTVNTDSVNQTISVLYQTEIVTVTTTQNSATLTIDGNTYSSPVKIPYDTQYIVTGSLSGYRASSETITANQSSRTVTVTFEELRSGIFVMTASGSEVDVEQATTSCIGVVVRDVKRGVAFLIPKVTSDDPLMYWSNNTTSVSGVHTTTNTVAAKGNYAGQSNTTAAIAANSSASYAPGYCYNNTIMINGNSVHGYLGAAGEWNIAYSNKTTIDNALSAIGSKPIQTTGHWTSTQFSNSDVWTCWWGYGGLNHGPKNNNGYVRPFYPLE